MNQAATRLLSDERSAVTSADLVVAVTDQLADRWISRYRRQVAVLPNGVDCALYQDVPTIWAERPDRPTAVLMGVLSERIDIEILEALPRAGIALHLIGPHKASFEPDRFASLVGNPLVRWYGPRPYRELPRLLARAEVGITPYSSNSLQ